MVFNTNDAYRMTPTRPTSSEPTPSAPPSEAPDLAEIATRYGVDPAKIAEVPAPTSRATMQPPSGTEGIYAVAEAIQDKSPEEAQRLRALADATDWSSTEEALAAFAEAVTTVLAVTLAASKNGGTIGPEDPDHLAVRAWIDAKRTRAEERGRRRYRQRVARGESPREAFIAETRGLPMLVIRPRARERSGAPVRRRRASGIRSGQDPGDPDLDPPDDPAPAFARRS